MSPTHAREAAKEQVTPTRRNALLSVADQAVSSVTNLLAVVLAARSLGSDGFGEFSVVYGIVVIVLGAVQAAVSQELVLVRGSAEQRRTATRAAVRFTLTVGSGLAVVFVAVGLVVPALLGSSLVAAVSLPLLLVQDCLRYGSSVRGHMAFALLLDVVWLVVLVAGAVLVTSVAGTPPVALLVGCWTVGGAVAGLVGCLGSDALHGGTAGRLHGLTGDYAKYRRLSFLGYRFLAEYAATRGTNQVLSVGLGGFVSLAAAGALRGMTTLYGPVNVLVQSVASFGAPLVDVAHERRRHRQLAAMGLAMAAAGAVATAVLLVLPDRWGTAILGATWARSQSLVLPLGLQATFVGIVIAGNLGLRLIRPRATLHLQLVATAVFVVLFLTGVAVNGTVGAAWALGLGTVFQALLNAGAYLRLSRRSSVVA